MSTTDVVRCNNVTKTFRATDAAPEQQVLQGVDLQLGAGEAIAIVGPSGCGKSTLLNLIGALDRPTGGTIAVAGDDLAGLTDDAITRLRNRRIGFVFQDHHLLPQATLLENVLLPCLAETGSATGEQVDRARGLLERVGLADRVDDWPNHLSGGQRQRVALARSMVMQPDVLLADEPTGALDEETAADMSDLLREVQRDTGTALIVVTHDTELAAGLGTVYRMQHGRLTTEADAA